MTTAQKIQEPATDQDDKRSDQSRYTFPLEGTEADAIAGSTLEDSELAGAIDERIASYHAHRAARDAAELAERRVSDADRAFDAMLRKYPGRVISYNGRLYAVREQILGNSFPAGPPVMHLQGPATPAKSLQAIRA